MDYRNRHVVVTGGTGALGSAVVGGLVAAGAVCHVPYLHAGEVEHYLLREHSQVKFIGPIELSEEAAVGRFYEGVPVLWGSIHLAGGFAAAPIGETTKADLLKQVEMNFVTAFLCCRAAVNAITRAGSQQSGRSRIDPTSAGGRIVNVAARAALEWRSGAGMVAYAASKAAVAAMTVALAEEVAKAGILVNAVAPSIMDTPANRAAMPKADHAAWPKVEEVAATILFLASPDNKVSRGGVVPVYGRS